MIGGTPPSAFGAVSAATVDGRSETPLIAVASSAGESCQFQKRVKSIFSADEQ